MAGTNPPTFLPNAESTTNIETILSNLLGTTARLIGIVVFIMLIIGGFTYLTSGGDPKKAEQATKTLTGAVVGIAIIIGGWFLLLILENITGINLTCFNLEIGTPCP